MTKGLRELTEKIEALEAKIEELFDMIDIMTIHVNSNGDELLKLQLKDEGKN